MIDMGMHSPTHRMLWLKYRCTWRMQWYILEVWSCTDYILGTDCTIFQDVAIQDT